MRNSDAITEKKETGVSNLSVLQIFAKPLGACLPSYDSNVIRKFRDGTRISVATFDRTDYSYRFLPKSETTPGTSTSHRSLAY